jgi:hypothetical protein
LNPGPSEGLVETPDGNLAKGMREPAGIDMPLFKR